MQNKTENDNRQHRGQNETSNLYSNILFSYLVRFWNLLSESTIIDDQASCAVAKPAGTTVIINVIINNFSIDIWSSTQCFNDDDVINGDKERISLYVVK